MSADDENKSTSAVRSSGNAEIISLPARRNVIRSRAASDSLVISALKQKQTDSERFQCADELRRAKKDEEHSLKEYDWKVFGDLGKVLLHDTSTSLWLKIYFLPE